jgi:hypothetical protein
MLPVLLALLLQSTTISGSLVTPVGMAPPASAEVVLLPAPYGEMFIAETQQLIDDFWHRYKADFAADKQLFFKVPPAAYKEALEVVTLRMRGDPKINTSNYLRTASAGRFEFRGVPPGDYKIIAMGSIRNTDYVWTESFQVTTTPVVIQLKNRIP